MPTFDIKRLTYLGLFALPISPLSTPAQPPPNDNRANATVIPSSLPQTVTGTNVGATYESRDLFDIPGTWEPGLDCGSPVFDPNPICLSGLTVWWQFTAPYQGTFSVDVRDSAFKASVGIAGRPVDLRDVSCDKFGQTAFTAARGTTVLIGVNSNVHCPRPNGPGEIVLKLEAVTPPFPQIEVSGNDAVIVNGDTSPSPSDHTDFAAVLLGDSLTRTFRIRNGGDLPLEFQVSPGPVNLVNGGTEFTVSQPTTTSLAVDAETEFSVTFAPTVAGPQFETVELTLLNLPSTPTFRFALRAEGVYEPAAWAPLLSDRFRTASRWTALGMDGPNFTGAIGARVHDPENSALLAIVQPTTTSRVIGWLEEPEFDLPYAAVTADNFVRAKFSVYYSGPGDPASESLCNKVPNFRLSLRTRGVVTTQLEVNHNAQTAGSLAQTFVTRELAPSTNRGTPSTYRVDLDPVDVPYFANSTTEGIQRGFETIVAGGTYPFVEGTLALVESSIGTYPALGDDVSSIKVFSSDGTAGASDFDNPGIFSRTLGLDMAKAIRFFQGGAQDYFNGDLLDYEVNVDAGTITQSPAGISINSVGAPNNRLVFYDVDFLSGVFGDTNATRLRIEPDRLYKVSVRIKHDGPSNSTPSTRFLARTAGFGWAQSLELAGARSLPSNDSRVATAQVLPGVGNQVPGSTAAGTVYHLLFNNPLDPSIRPDIPGTLDLKFPNLFAQPGPGDDTIGAGSPPDGSLKNVNFGFRVIDSLTIASNSTNDPAEVANNVQLNRIEVRSYPDVEIPQEPVVTPGVPLAITSTVAEAVHDARTQTLTFTFEEDVEGFDADDILLTGAQKGPFTEVSGSVYTLDIEATGGKVVAKVAADAAQTPSSLGNKPAEFTNFYQDTWTVMLPGEVPMELIRIPAGTFMMGSPETEANRRSDEPLHRVTITRDFYMGKTEVTQEQFMAFGLSRPWRAQFGLGGDIPAYELRYADAVGFAEVMNSASLGGTFRLPTEAEWEYACRAGTTTRFSFGDGADQQSWDLNMWHDGNRVGFRCNAVGLKPANPWGLFDMHGNVEEYSSGWYGPYPEGAFLIDPQGPATGTLRVVRGGGVDSIGHDCRSAFRSGVPDFSGLPDFFVPSINWGMRVVGFPQED